MSENNYDKDAEISDLRDLCQATANSFKRLGHNEQSLYVEKALSESKAKAMEYSHQKG